MTRLICRRRFIQTSAATIAVVAGGLPLVGRAEEAARGPRIDNIIAAPRQADHWPEWRRRLAKWRSKIRKRLGYDDSYYRREEFAWTTSNFCCSFAMMCDEEFYDRATGEYMVEAFLDRGVREFGGYDSVVLWHAYPRIGFDERNQFDFYRHMPGGLAGLRKVTGRFQRRGVKVFINYNPWDTGTRREGRSDVDALVDMVRAIAADGIFLDTLSEGVAELRTRLDAARPGVALESELALPLSAVDRHHLSWAQWFDDSETPGVLRNKWFERRHIQHQIKRWNDDHTSELQTAWMNGSGMMVWENVFGSLKPWSARDRSLLRSILPIQRRYHGLFAGEDWTPLVPVSPAGVYGSRWGRGGLRLWTLVNRGEKPVVGRIERIEPDGTSIRWFDLVAGREIAPERTGERMRVSVPLGPRGVGAVLAVDEAGLDRDFAGFLAHQRKTASRASYDRQVVTPEPRLTPVGETTRYRRDMVPEGMTLIDVDRQFTMRSTITSRECGFYVKPYSHDAIGRHKEVVDQAREVRLRPYAIDVTPVTNAQYAEFLKASGYEPAHPENFLKHWRDGSPRPGRENHPVVYVDLDDARAYARWTGKRLPTEEQWQYAAAGPDALRYPWGEKMDHERCNAGASGGTTPVAAYPTGRSPFGCYDMCGNTWEWTESERSDGRTRFAIIKGGCWYRADGSQWYADGGPRPTDHAAKFLLMWPGLDRCSTVGFRCVVDVGQ